MRRMSMPAAHPFDFDPTHGFTLDRLRGIAAPEGPPEFDGFWRARLGRALQVDPRPRLRRSALGHADWVVDDIAYTSTDDFPIGGWLLLPRTGAVRRGLVVGHGYGGRQQPDFGFPVQDTAVLFPCCRGLSRSRRPPIPDDPAGHVLTGIASPDSFILGGCVEDIWVGVSVLTRLWPELRGRIGYSGTSFGGGIGALALAFDQRLDRGHLEVPTFGNMPLWLSLPSIGSARSVQAYVRAHPGRLDTLRLFDAASAARRIVQPMLTAVARFDPAVAPPCQFSVANALGGGHHETVILDAGHFDYPESGRQQALHRAKVEAFFGVA